MVGNFILSENRNTYGGEILASDFCTDYKGSRNVVKRITDDWSFDRSCKMNISKRKNGQKGDLGRWR